MHDLHRPFALKDRDGVIHGAEGIGHGSSAGAVIVNSSRAVLYASSGDDFEQTARHVAMQTRDTLEAAKL
jgi:hypothetical protein